jgi:signal transduction histidine kinase
MASALSGLTKTVSAPARSAASCTGRSVDVVSTKTGSTLSTIALTPIDAEDGPIALATVVDITARTHAETELARRAAELELANERLAQFAYVASHEPLRKIAVYAGLLNEAIAKSDADDIARATGVIATSAVRARRLVDNLLTFSRVGRARRGSASMSRPSSCPPTACSLDG